MTRYVVMLLASERFIQRWNDVLTGAVGGVVVFYLIRWLGWI